MRTWVSTGQDNITRWDTPLGCLQLILDGSGAYTALDFSILWLNGETAG